MNTTMLAGIICGFIVGIILVAMILRYTKTNGKVKCEYDERQEIIRGKGFKYAFFTLLIFNALYGMIDLTLERPVADNIVVLMTGIILSVLVYAGYAIWHECYFALNENPVKVLVSFGIISAVNFVLTGIYASEGWLVYDGKLTFYCTNFLAGMMFVVICAMLGLKVLLLKRGEIMERSK